MLADTTSRVNEYLLRRIEYRIGENRVLRYLPQTPLTSHPATGACGWGRRLLQFRTTVEWTPLSSPSSRHARDGAISGLRPSGAVPPSSHLGNSEPLS